MKPILKKLLWPVLILMLGILAMLGMAGLKADIPTHNRPSPSLHVTVMTAVPKSLAPTLKGYGRARVVNTVTVASEVKGRLIYVNPALEPGETLPKGALLFEVDPTAFQLSCDELAAVRDRLESRITSLEIEQAADRARYDIALANQALAAAEFKRLSRLFEKKVASRSKRDEAEQALNLARDLAASLSAKVKASPFALAQARSSLSETNARLALAKTDLARCRRHAPFDCRVKAADIEAGQYVSPGQTAAILADDSLVEIHVSLDSREAGKWLKFDPLPGGSWFSGLAQVPCRVFWTADTDDRFLPARVHRVVTVNPDSRALVLAVRMAPEPGGPDRFPLVEGMFCRVDIPGKTRADVFCVPDSALGEEDRVFLADKGRARAVKVRVIHFKDQHFYADAGISPGDRIILTPLPASADNSPITIIKGENR